MRSTAIVVTFVLSGLVVGVVAQQAPFKRTVLQTAISPCRVAKRSLRLPQYSRPPRSAGTRIRAKRSVCDRGSVLVSRKASRPQRQRGQMFLITAGAIYNATNKGSVQRDLATYIVENGKPLATPVTIK